MYSIIAITGDHGQGKTTLAKHIQAKYDYKMVSISGKMKQSMGALFGLTKEQLFGPKKDIIDPIYNMTPRDLMRVFGTDCVQKVIGRAIIDARRQLGQGIGQNEQPGPQYLRAEEASEIHCELLFRDLAPGNYVIDDLYYLPQCNYLSRLCRMSGGTLTIIKLVRDDPKEHDVPFNHLIYNDGTMSHLYIKFAYVYKRYIIGTICGPGAKSKK